jgi:DNA (cytosine-5)-methyltransferase 1
MFAGIGGIDLGLERTGGFKTAWFAEIDPYASAVLRKHWPDVPNYGDVRNIGEDAERVDLIAAGFPCQPVSLAGKGLAQEDPRWLWPEVARVVGLLRPRYVLLENVPGLRKRGLSIVIGDLAALGYDAEWQIVSAASVGAPHLRERYIIAAYAYNEGQNAQSFYAEVAQSSEPVADSTGSRSPEALLQWEQASERHAADSGWWLTEPDVDRVVDGIPDRVDRIRSLGNAVVPQVAEAVGRLILETAV